MNTKQILFQFPLKEMWWDNKLEIVLRDSFEISENILLIEEGEKNLDQQKSRQVLSKNNINY